MLTHLSLALSVMDTMIIIALQKRRQKRRNAFVKLR